METTPPPIATPDSVRAFLSEHGMTHAQLADWLGVAEFTVTRWVNGIGSISMPRVLGLALEAVATRLTT